MLTLYRRFYAFILRYDACYYHDMCVHLFFSTIKSLLQKTINLPLHCGTPHHTTQPDHFVETRKSARQREKGSSSLSWIIIAKVVQSSPVQSRLFDHPLKILRTTKWVLGSMVGIKRYENKECFWKVHTNVGQFITCMTLTWCERKVRTEFCFISITIRQLMRGTKIVRLIV